MAAVRRFGTTWWGRAWVDALEQRAALDPNRLARGRTYARQDRVARLELEPGKITALVRGNRALPYRVSIAVTTYDADGWARLATAIAARAANAAALLEGELDPGIVDDADAAGVALLPTKGDLRPQCSCPDWADPCKHAAAVCYLVADALDADPQVLFTLRGSSPDAVAAAVRAARSRPGGSPRSDEPPVAGRAVASTFGGGALVDPGMVAREAWSRTVAPLPERRDLPPEPGAPAGWPADPPRDAPFTAEGLTTLVADAARRAWAQLADGTSAQLALAAPADLARRAADRLDRGEPLSELARRAGVTSSELAHRALAWRSAGTEGIDVLGEALWRPPDQVIARGIAAFADAGVDPADVQVRSNRLTAGEVQLRVSADGRWWRFERQGRTWELVEPPTEDPGDLVS